MIRKIVLCSCLLFACEINTLLVAQSIAEAPVYLQDHQPLEIRVQDALSRMTLEEKVRLSYAQSKFSSPGCARLGIPELWMSDGPHGVRAEISWNSWRPAGWSNDSCTAFPALTCLAASWNPDLAAAYGLAIGEEARYREKDVLLGPGVNIYRTPLNGRNFEYLGEDPYLASVMCVPYIQGIQKNGVAACVKHFALNNQELWREHIDVEVSDRALYEIYLPAFRSAVKEGDVWCVMGAYNKFRGTFATHNDFLNNKILKEGWGFDGCVISDWGAAHDTYEAAMYGLDIEMGTYTDGLALESKRTYDDYYLGKSYLKMVKEGRIPTEVVNDKAARVLRLIFRTAMNRQKPFGFMNTDEHHQVAYRVATEGIVLLKNEANKVREALLPIPRGKYRNILVVGDNATRKLTVGGGSSQLKVKQEISPLEGLKARFGGCIHYAQGYPVEHPVSERVHALRREAVEKAADADLVVFIGGLNKEPFQDCEGKDRVSYGLPYAQDELIRALVEVNPKTVVVLLTGNAVEMPWIEEIPAVVQAWYLGSFAGEALADILSGEVNPSGKLPFSYPVKLMDCPAHAYGALSYPGDSIRLQYQEDILVGYRWYDTKRIQPLFSFGHGMSYTTFEYSQPVVSSRSIKGGETLNISLTVKNTGEIAGKEIIQLYIGDEKCTVLRPLKELKGFQKVELKPGEEKSVSFTIEAKDLSFFDEKTREWVAEPGTFKAYIASSASDIRSVVEFKYRKE